MDWDNKLLYFLSKDYRVIANDRRGHGSCSQTSAALAANRAPFYIDVASGPFYGYNRPGAEPNQGLIDRWWAQGMMGAANAHYKYIKAFSETDFTEDLKRIDVPVLVTHGTDDQVVPYADAGPKSAEILRNATLKTYEGYPHGMLSVHPPAASPTSRVSTPSRPWRAVRRSGLLPRRGSRRRARPSGLLARE